MTVSCTQRRLALGAAFLTTIVGLAMAAAAALDRGGTLLDRALIVAVACVLVLMAHLLPSLSRSVTARLLWLGCVVLTAWGHATFFTAAAQRAGEVRAEAVATTSQAQALESELQSIQARPLAVVSSELAAAQARADSAAITVERCRRTANAENTCQRQMAQADATRLKVSSLFVEMKEAERVANLRTRLVEAAGEHDAARHSAAVDPVASSVASLLGIKAEWLSTGVSVLSAMMVELLAALLWSIGLQVGAAASAASAVERRPSSEPKKTVVRNAGAMIQTCVTGLRRLTLRWKAQLPGRPHHDLTDPISGAVDHSAQLLNRIRPSGREQGVRSRSRLSTTAVAPETGRIQT